MEDFDFNDTAPVPLTEQEFLMENLCVRKGRAPGGYEPPATRSAAKRWKNIHEQNVMTKLNGMHIIKKQNAQMSKEAAREIIRKIPVELLAKEWLSKEDATVDMRAYLVDHILPTLILGVERLLKEVDEKGLSATNRFEPEFNPINFLAQYLMRNNPRFSNFAEASPYVRGLREVSEEIKQELFTFEDNRLARIKAEARRKRTDRERHEQQIREGKEHRHNQLISQFTEWTHFTENKCVELSLLQNALRSFAETVETLPADLQDVAKFGHPLEPTDETGKTLTLKEFAEYISLFVEDLPHEVFQLFMMHMSKCAATQKASVDKNTRKIILTNLFLICDYGELRFMIADRKLGLLDRARILTLFEDFWDNIMDTREQLGTLMNPRRWPVVEVDEVDDILFDAWDGEPDGGVSAREIDVQNKYLEAIRSALLQEAEITAAKNKAAREKWKKEQLEQKSEGYRVKLYKYNATDFMNLIQYPFLDTMEAPIRYFDNTDGRLTKEHDLYVSTLTRTARERSRKPHESDSFLLKASEECKSSTERDSRTTPDGREDPSIESGSKRESERNRRFSKKFKDKNLNSNIQDVNLKDNEEKLSKRPVNKSNNKLESEESSSDESKDSSKDFPKTKIKATSRQRKRIKRVVGFNGVSDESSEEAEVITKPQLRFSKPSSPFSSEDEIVQQRLNSYSFPKEPLLKYKDNIPVVDYNLYRRTKRTTLPPVRIHKSVDDGGSSGDTVMSDDATEWDDMTAGAETAGREDATIAKAVYGDNERIKIKTIATKDTTVDTATGCESSTVVSKDDNSELESAGKDEKSTVDTSATVSFSTIETEKNESLSVEAAGKYECSAVDLDESSIMEEDTTAQENTDNVDEPSKGDKHMHILAADNQNDDSLAEKNKDINTKSEEDDVNKDIKENIEASKLDVEGCTGDSALGTLTVHEGTLKDQGKTDNELTAKLRQMNASGFEKKTGVEIMRELVASQSKMLGSKTTSANSGGIIKGRKIVDFPMPAKDYISESIEDINYNRQSENLNVNSCGRGRQINPATSASRDPVQLSAFSENYLDLAQFMQLFETYIGPEPDDKIFATLVWFITEGYQDNEPEKTDILLQFRDKAGLARRKAMLNVLYEKWDNDGSGFLELEDVVDVMCRFKDGQEIEAIRCGQSHLKAVSKYQDNRLSKKEFRLFINLVMEELPGKETFDLFVEFLMNSVEDAETHGGEKRISASIAMLEVNKLEPSRGELLLRYSACTPEDCQYMLGKPLYKNMKGVSFQAVESGKPVHIPRVASHGSVYFWNYDRLPSERGGSFIAFPLKDNKKRIFGVLGVDTMIDPNKETIFITHEIQFFQGVAKAFSVAYHLVEKKRKFLRVLESAISWFHIRCPHILEIDVYFVEPSSVAVGDYVLRKMMIKDKNGAPLHISELIRLERKDNLFRKYLFDCMETSETTLVDVNDARHTACPIRDNHGTAVGIVDLNTGNLKMLPRYESREAQRMLRLLQMAHCELTNVSKGDDPDCVLEAENDPAFRTEIMFERIMLQEMRDNILRLDSQSFGEIRGYYEPPRVIADILRATMAIFKIDQVGEGEYDNWDDLKNCINNDLIQQIKTFDPTAFPNTSIPEKIERYLKATFSVSFGEISEQGSIPAQQLYNWVFTCLSLIEHVIKFKESAVGSMLMVAGVEDKKSELSLKQKK